MKTIFSIIALPVTISISLACFFFVLILTSDFKEKNGVSAFHRIQIEARNLLLNESWHSIHPFAQATISFAIYYVVFF